MFRAECPERRVGYPPYPVHALGHGELKTFGKAELCDGGDIDLS